MVAEDEVVPMSSVARPRLYAIATAEPARSRDPIKEHRLLRPDDVDRQCAQEDRSRGLVAGLLARRSVSVLVGDSGIGKSPLAYQLGLCVAAGVPFLQMPTQPGPVIYADYENALEESRDLREQLVRSLNLDKTPQDFILWTPDYTSSLDVDGICSDLKPSLFIIDSLRSHNHEFENVDHVAKHMQALRSAAYKHDVSLLAVHHVRKPGQEAAPALDEDETILMQWLNQAAGARGIMNQSDTRIACDYSGKVRDAAMVLRWQSRVRGERGPLYVERVCDDDGNPLGYRPMTGASLLSNEDQRQAFQKLPEVFTFGQAKQTYCRSDDPTRKWLLKCISAGLVEQVKRGEYRKLPTGAVSASSSVERIEREPK